MIKIRTATKEDAEKLLEIYSWYVKNTAITFEWDVPDSEEFRCRIVTTLQKHPWLVAEENGELLGYAYTGAFKGRQSYDWSAETSIYLKPEVRGRGLGQRLYEALEKVSRMQGITNLYACVASPGRTDPWLDDSSMEFHAHMGYRLVGRFEKCASKFDRWYDMIWMEKHLSKHEEKPQAVIPFPELV